YISSNLKNKIGRQFHSELAVFANNQSMIMRKFYGPKVIYSLAFNATRHYEANGKQVNVEVPQGIFLTSEQQGELHTLSSHYFESQNYFKYPQIERFVNEPCDGKFIKYGKGDVVFYRGEKPGNIDAIAVCDSLSLRSLDMASLTENQKKLLSSLDFNPKMIVDSTGKKYPKGRDLPICLSKVHNGKNEWDCLPILFFRFELI
ncbi:unnamed protein product, partial [marine sediment metagenome]